jgi:hypothetical protein
MCSFYNSEHLSVYYNVRTYYTKQIIFSKEHTTFWIVNNCISSPHILEPKEFTNIPLNNLECNCHTLISFT